jgi:predicted N-acetyltransferase YhbS
MGDLSSGGAARIGSALVRAALAAADREGEPLVVLEGRPRYFGRLGFMFATAHGIVIDLPDWAPGDAAQVYRLSRYDSASGDASSVGQPSRRFSVDR